jgi:hypothetical protein
MESGLIEIYRGGGRRSSNVGVLESRAGVSNVGVLESRAKGGRKLQTRSSMSTARARDNACNTRTVGRFLLASICET